MMRRLWGWIVHPWRRDRSFARRMHDARSAALEQSRISMRQQRHLRERTNFMADDLLGGGNPPPPERSSHEAL